MKRSSPSSASPCAALPLAARSRRSPGCCCAWRRGAPSSRRPIWSSVCACRSRPCESTPGHAVIPGRLLLDVVRSLPTEQVSLEYRSAQQDVEVVAGPSKFHLRTLPPEDFPKLPEAPAEGGMTVPAGRLRGHDHAGGPGGVAGRDPAAPHRRAGHRHRPRAAHGGDRLVPPGGEGDAARGRARGVARGERSGPNAPGAGPDRQCRRHRQHRRRRAREPGGVHDRRRGAVVAARRGALPELQAAAARVV